MSGEWPADPTDPRCPECGEPVSATASYCMHCEADLPGATVDADPAASDDVGAAASGTAQGGGGGVENWSSTDESGAGREDAWIDPDSLLDNVSTVAVGVVGSLLTWILAGLVTFWLLPPVVEDAAFWLGLAGGAVAGLWMARSRTVFDAARRASYTVGGLLALVPPAVAIALSWQDPSEAVVGIFVFGIFLWPIALAVVGLGWFLGRGGVENDGEE